MKVPTTPENKAKCICGSCPTFTKNSLKVGAFCTLGKSEKTPKIQGCACTTCPVFGEYTLSEGYFCLHGAAE